jgi:hypothetical protein
MEVNTKKLAFPSEMPRIVMLTVVPADDRQTHPTFARLSEGREA